MLSVIRDILVIVNKGQLSQFKKILSDGSRFGVRIKYKEQMSPRGLPDAFILGESFIGKDNVSLILGDNFFYAQSLTAKLKESVKLNSGCKVFLHPVKKPEFYGVATIKNKKITQLVEKPKKTKSNLAVTGLYFFDNKVIEYSKSLKPSKRNELEIIEVLKRYLRKNKLKAEYLGRGGAWLDTGSINDFYDTSAFVSAIETRQGLKIACLEEIAFNNKWINKKQVLEAIKFYGNNIYSKYLKDLL